MEELLTVEEVSRLLKVEPRTVRRWLRDGELMGIRVGREWRIEEDALKRFLDERRNK